MGNPYLEGAEWVTNPKSGGGSYDGAPVRLVLHTVEGDPGSVDGCRNMAATHTSPPQLWYHPGLRWLGQCIPLDRSGYAMAHPSGTPETNKAGAIQCELFGFAADAGGWGVELDNIGQDVVGAVVAAGWPVDLEQLAPTTGSDGYGTDGAVRFGWDQWAAWPGVCCHSNVPGNDHWDAGALDLARIARAAGGSSSSGGDQPTEDDMPLHLVVGDRDPEWWLTDLVTKRYVGSPEEADRIVVRTVAQGGRIEATQGEHWGPVMYDQRDVDAIPTVP